QPGPGQPGGPISDPPSRGVPHQGGQPGGYQQYGYPQQGYGQPGPYGQPPKKKAGLIIGLPGAGAVIAALSQILGLLAPGFLLGGGDPKSVAEDLADAANNKDASKLLDTFCDSSEMKGKEFDPSKDDENVSLNVTVTGDATERSDSEAVVPIKVSTTVM